MGSSGSKPEFKQKKPKEKEKGIPCLHPNQEDQNETEYSKMAQNSANASAHADVNESLEVEAFGTENNEQITGAAKDPGRDGHGCEDLTQKKNSAKDMDNIAKSKPEQSKYDADAHETNSVTNAPSDVPKQANAGYLQNKFPPVHNEQKKHDSNNDEDEKSKKDTNHQNEKTPVPEEQKEHDRDVKSKQDKNGNLPNECPSALKEQTKDDSDNDKVDESKQEQKGNVQNESPPALKEQTKDDSDNDKVDESKQDNNDNFQNGSPPGANEKKDTNSNKKGKDDEVEGKTKSTSKSKEKTKDTSTGLNKNQTAKTTKPREEPKLNVDFYSNTIVSKPYPGSKIEDMLEWKGDYVRLERGHSYIQWLFPIPEGPGLNYHAQALSEEEAKIIRNDDTMRNRVLQAYEMMLDFYGMELEDVNSGKVRRCESNWKERFEHLNRSRHNYMRITRIIKSIGELGFEHLQRGFVHFIITEAVVTKELDNMNGDSVNFWIHALKDEHDLSDMYKYWQETCENPESFNEHGEKKSSKEKANEDNGDNSGDQSGDKSDMEGRESSGKNGVSDVKSDENIKEIEKGEEKKTCSELDNGTSNDGKELQVNKCGNDEAVDENGKKDDSTISVDRKDDKTNGGKNNVSSEKVDAKAEETNQAEGQTNCSDMVYGTNNDGKKLQVNKGGKDGAVDENAKKNDSIISGDQNGDKSDMEGGKNGGKNNVSDEKIDANADEKYQAKGKSDMDDETTVDSKELKVNERGKDGAESEPISVNKGDTRDGSVVTSGNDIQETPSMKPDDVNGGGDELVNTTEAIVETHF